MLKALPMDAVVSPSDEITQYLSQHAVAFVLLGIAVVVAIVLIIAAYRKPRRKGRKRG